MGFRIKNKRLNLVNVDRSSMVPRARKISVRCEEVWKIAVCSSPRSPRCLPLACPHLTSADPLACISQEQDRLPEYQRNVAENEHQNWLRPVSPIAANSTCTITCCKVSGYFRPLLKNLSGALNHDYLRDPEWC